MTRRWRGGRRCHRRTCWRITIAAAFQRMNARIRLDVLVAGEERLVLRRCGGRGGRRDAICSSLARSSSFADVAGTGGALSSDDRIDESILLGLGRVDVGELSSEVVEHDLNHRRVDRGSDANRSVSAGMVSSVTGAADRTVMHRRGVPREPRPRRLGVGGPRRTWANGFDPDTTNQRMELMAVLDALRTIEGPVEVVSDSTYVVNCFRDRWWEGWLKRGWKNSKKEPVANRDLWEPLVELYRGREEEITFTWVKGHAVTSTTTSPIVWRWRHTHGSGTPWCRHPRRSRPPDEIDASGSVRRRLRRSRGPTACTRPRGCRPARQSSSRGPATQLGGYDPNPIADEVRRQITEILVAKAELHPDLVVVTGLRLGAETLAAEAAAEAELPFVAVLPFPDPEIKWPAATQRRFHELLAEASAIVRLEEGASRQPGGRPGAGPPQRLAAQDRHGSDRRVGPRRTPHRQGRAGARTGDARRRLDRQPLSMRWSAGSSSGSMNS